MRLERDAAAFVLLSAHHQASHQFLTHGHIFRSLTSRTSPSKHSTVPCSSHAFRRNNTVDTAILAYPSFIYDPSISPVTRRVNWASALSKVFVVGHFGKS